MDFAGDGELHEVQQQERVNKRFDFLHHSLLVDLFLEGLIEEALVRILLRDIDIGRLLSNILGLLCC